MFYGAVRIFLTLYCFRTIIPIFEVHCVRSGKLHQKNKTSSKSSREAIKHKFFLGRTSWDSQVMTDVCQTIMDTSSECDPYTRYRLHNGTCNNLLNPSWCSAIECYQRLIPAYYEGRGGFRKSVLGGDLPNPRKISMNINSDENQPSSKMSSMMAVFGQYVAHDISLARFDKVNISCCQDEHAKHPSCAPIHLTTSDPYYSLYNITCLDNKRTVPCPSCESDKKQQPNAHTATIDASVTYGISYEEAIKLRTMDGTGRLRLIYSPYGELMPNNEDPSLFFCPLAKINSCFMAGDVRVNQHALLSGIHTMMFREHNRIADILRDLNPHWDDEQLYQEARKILGAELQNIVYKEYLPTLLGHDAMNHYGLSVGKSGDATRYDPSVRCGVWQSYAQGVGRMHTLVASDVDLGVRSFENFYSNSALVRNGSIGNLFERVCRVSSQNYDRHMVVDVSPHMYFYPDKPYGLDLALLDIFRGRDHGLPPYAHLVKFCNEESPSIHSFADLETLMTKENIQLLKQNYKHVEDVDQWIGAQMERYVEGAQLGPTAMCIFGIQFHTLKYGDRFFFEHEGEAPSFTRAQRESLKQSSLSRLMCDNLNMDQLQRNSLLLPSFQNPILPCDMLQQVDFQPWKETSFNKQQNETVSTI